MKTGLMIIGKVLIGIVAILGVVLPYADIQQFMDDVMFSDLLWRVLMEAVILTIIIQIARAILRRTDDFWDTYAENGFLFNINTNIFIMFIFMTIAMVGSHILLPLIMIGLWIIDILLSIINFFLGGIGESIGNIFAML